MIKNIENVKIFFTVNKKVNIFTIDLLRKYIKNAPKVSKFIFIVSMLKLAQNVFKFLNEQNCKKHNLLDTLMVK